ncbi:MAG: Hsp20/alpha crystallin family protein [bacterium]
MANLVNWVPSRRISDLVDDMSLIRNFFAPSAEINYGLGSWMPPVDIEETLNEYIVKADVPGVKKDDIKISLENGTLTLSGERKEEKGDMVKNFLVREKDYGSFCRSFDLPYSVNMQDIKAVYADGVLTINIPKSEEAKPREIKIEVK